MSQETDWPSLIAGSVLVVAGSSIAGLYSFDGQELAVFVGFCLFVLGYFLARDGWVILSPVEHPVRDAEASLHADHPLVRSAVGLVGIYGIAAGVTQFSLTVIDPSVISAVRAGVYSVGGYAWTHVVIHQSLF
ncbi:MULTISPECIES: hypothetical protein [Halolamina]|uniref:hypothetical protein n=1 Tax=Halolamina TaxID=1075397 RepID=UPI000941CF5B|nr:MULTISPECIES: hypothetical protein [Halolamina]NHX37612.1 hypothetical protein [Halolamina sp. R1-12]